MIERGTPLEAIALLGLEPEVTRQLTGRLEVRHRGVDIRNCEGNDDDALTATALGADIVICGGAIVPRTGPERVPSIRANGARFARVAEAVNLAAPSHVVVWGPYASSMCTVVDSHLQVPSRTTITGVTMHTVQAAHRQVADLAGCAPAAVSGVVVWGDDSRRMVVDTRLLAIDGEHAAAVLDEHTLCGLEARVRDELYPQSVHRSTIDGDRAASAITCHVDALLAPTATATSMIVPTGGAYEAPGGVHGSFPVIAGSGLVEIIDDLVLDASFRIDRLHDTYGALVEERDLLMVNAALGPWYVSGARGRGT